ncbi:MAG: DUF6600 domain-containing protein [Chthoniobacterales bacterium]
MKNVRSLFGIIALAVVLLSAPIAKAQVNFDYFYNALEPYGDWIEVSDYGYCFKPWVDVGWRPYTDGYWASTDEGWLWVSNEDWGGITYHYGRWLNLEDQGWVWVPGYEWAPAWVAWRQSDNYIGWAPLPPQVVYVPEVGIQYDTGFGAGGIYEPGPLYYNFCEPRNFGYLALQSYLLPPQQNIYVIGKTVNITNYGSVTVIGKNNRIIINNGPNLAAVNRISTQPVRQLNIVRQSVDFNGMQANVGSVRDSVHGNQFVTAAPEITHSANIPPPRKVKEHFRHPWVNDGFAGITDQTKANVVRQELREQAHHSRSSGGTSTAQGLISAGTPIPTPLQNVQPGVVRTPQASATPSSRAQETPQPQQVPERGTVTRTIVPALPRASEQQNTTTASPVPPVTSSTEAEAVRQQQKENYIRQQHERQAHANPTAQQQGPAPEIQQQLQQQAIERQQQRRVNPTPQNTGSGSVDANTQAQQQLREKQRREREAVQKVVPSPVASVSVTDPNAGAQAQQAAQKEQQAAVLRERQQQAAAQQQQAAAQREQQQAAAREQTAQRAQQAGAEREQQMAAQREQAAAREKQAQQAATQREQQATEQRERAQQAAAAQREQQAAAQSAAREQQAAAARDQKAAAAASAQQAGGK